MTQKVNLALADGCAGRGDKVVRGVVKCAP